jgi:membrane-associated phospholipid phosphatase
MDFFIVHRRIFVLNFISIAIFAWFSFLVTRGEQPMFDVWVFAMRSVFSSEALLTIMGAISTVFDPFVLLALTVLLFIVLLFYHKKRYAVLLLSSMSLALFLSTILKIVFAIDRPESGIEVMGNSFPSAHATGATVFFLTILFLLDKKIKDRTLHFLVTFVAVGIVVMTGASRLYLGVHWASDVVAGFALGVFSITLSLLIMKRAEYQHVIHHS